MTQPFKEARLLDTTKGGLSKGLFICNALPAVSSPIFEEVF